MLYWNIFFPLHTHYHYWHSVLSQKKFLLNLQFLAPWHSFALSVVTLLNVKVIFLCTSQEVKVLLPLEVTPSVCFTVIVYSYYKNSNLQSMRISLTHANFCFQIFSQYDDPWIKVPILCILSVCWILKF